MNTPNDSFGRSSNDALSTPTLNGNASRAKAVNIHTNSIGDTWSTVNVNMFDEDCRWFVKHNAKIAMEFLNNQHEVGIYADVGLKFDDGSPYEIVHIVNAKEYQNKETFRILRKLCEQSVQAEQSIDKKGDDNEVYVY